MNVKHGKSFENLFPFMSNYPYDSRNFRFIGDPIDGLSFEDNKIVFIEFKTGISKLSEKQKRIKELVEAKKVEWKEIRDI
jgi:predicted Holliday junction resolvase-like endonuclease